MQPRQSDEEDETNLDDTDKVEDEEDDDVEEEADCEKGIEHAVKKSVKDLKKHEYQQALKEAEKRSLQDFHDQVYTEVQRDILRLPRPGTVPPLSKPDKDEPDSSDVSKSKTQDKN